MFRKRKSFNQKNEKGNYSRFSGRPRRKNQPKELDASLFVKKAVHNPVQDIEEKKTLFSVFDFQEQLQKNIAEHGYTYATPIQEQAIPAIMAEKDVIGIANTGTGKTAAFLLPLISKVLSDKKQQVIIVAPTRELAKQIVDELYAFTRGMDISCVLAIGGADLFRQTKRLQQRPNFVIGTPGRLKDLIERKRLNLQYFQNFVLDEVDKMVDIGFINDIKFFVSLLPKVRLSLFFSATMTDKVQSILNDFVQNPFTITLKRQDTSENVEQDIIRIKNQAEKIEVLHDLLIRKEFNKVLVFGRTKWGIEKLMKSLEERGLQAVTIHGNKSQGQRHRALDAFKNERVRIMLATDVASRGLDIDNVTHVINYDAPESYDDYIHRIGRTGRAGKKGTAITFVQ